jgi:LysR family transcriptional activator of nhaA
MDWLNYHHLYYFWLVAREGSIAGAAKQLQLANPTISKQLQQLESSFKEKLFKRVGRNLVLTEFGQKVFGYAQEIFTVGRELQDEVRGRPTGRPMRFIVGIPDVLPKLICFRLLRPIFEISEDIQIVCHEGRYDELMTDLAAHRLDVVISDAPASPTLNVRLFNHLLGECGISFFAKPEMAAKYRRKFPHSLHGAPMLLPTEKTVLRRELEQWFDVTGIRPQVVGEFEDTALMKVFGQDGLGLFPAPSAIKLAVSRQYRVSVVGHTEEVRERYYAISVERRIKHPAVVAICEAARGSLFPS